jgi:hypothetical protein
MRTFDCDLNRNLRLDLHHANLHLSITGMLKLGTLQRMAIDSEYARQV